MPLLTTAYAGTADINEENLDALLNQLLPDGPLGMVYIPAGTIVKRNQPGLAKVVNWLQNNPNGVGVEGTIPVPDLIQAMLERNEKLQADDQEPDELVLVMVYNNASGLDNSLVKEAHENGIRVVDLCAAGDDIVPEEPAAEAEAPAEEPPWEDDKPTDPTPAPPKEEAEPAKSVRRATSAGKAAAAKHGVTPATEVAVPGKPLDEVLAAADALHGTAPAPGSITINVSVTLPPGSIQDIASVFAPAIVAAMGAQAQAVVEAPLASVTSLPVGDRGSNKADVAGQPEGTRPFYYNEDEGKYRPARGVKRRNEERVFLTDDEIAAARASKMLS